jgi:hypothetical protein
MATNEGAPVQPETSITTVAHVIQLAVAPVFLLTGIGAILAVLTNRLARVVDRFRVLERSLPETGMHPRAGESTEMARLSRRSRLIHWAISLCTVAALLICIVIATLFIGSILNVDVSATIASLFIAAMLALIAGLLSFLREIALATGVLEEKRR